MFSFHSRKLVSLSLGMMSRDDEVESDMTRTNGE